MIGLEARPTVTTLVSRLEAWKSMLVSLNLELPKTSVDTSLANDKRSREMN
jgi:hypothetical protein